MAGERTGYIVAQVRDMLAEHSKRIFPTDALIHNQIARIQLSWAVIFKTSKRFYDIILASDRTSYPLNPRLFSIKDFYGDEENTNHYEGRYIHSTHSITIDSDTIITGEKIIVEGFIKPVKKATWKPDPSGEDQTIADVINETTDPIIEEEYDDYIALAILSSYSTKERPQRSFESVTAEVKILAERLASINRWSTGHVEAQTINTNE